MWKTIQRVILRSGSQTRISEGKEKVDDPHVAEAFDRMDEAFGYMNTAFGHMNDAFARMDNPPNQININYKSSGSAPDHKAEAEAYYQALQAIRRATKSEQPVSVRLKLIEDIAANAMGAGQKARERRK